MFDNTIDAINGDSGDEWDSHWSAFRHDCMTMFTDAEEEMPSFGQAEAPIPLHAACVAAMLMPMAGEIKLLNAHAEEKLGNTDADRKDQLVERNLTRAKGG